MIVRAPAKLNLCLYLGPRRPDGLHRLVSVFEPLDLGDEVEIVEAGADQADRVEFELDDYLAGTSDEEVDDLASRSTVHKALIEARAAGLSVPPCSIRVHKRIPLGAGLGGGSADGAAVLRWIGARFPGDVPLESVAMRIGADVPSQLAPETCLVRGAGERIEPLAPAPRHFLVLLSGGGGLATGAVFAEADRLGLGRSEEELDQLEMTLRDASPEALLTDFENDLERAARSLRPDLAEAFEVLEDVGALRVAMTGSGSTVYGMFGDRNRAEQAAEALGRADAVVCEAGMSADAEAGAQ